MNGLEGMAIGVVATALAVAIYFGARKTWALATSMTVALGVVPELVTSVKELLAGFKRMEAIAAEFSRELQYLRGVAAQTQVGGDPYSAPQQVAVPGETAEFPGFPKPIWERFKQAPVVDATIEDTDVEVLSQTDEELAQIEHIETLRRQGMIINDEPGQEPGVVVESE